MYRRSVGFFCAVFLLFFSFSHALERRTGSDRIGIGAFGIKAGISFSDVNSEELPPVDSRTGITFGGFLNVTTTDYLELQIEALYMTKGFKFTRRVEGPLGENVFEDNTVKLDYVEFPILIRALVPTEENLRPNFYIGPAFSLLLSTDFEVDPPTDDPEFILDNANKLDLGLVLGGGVDFELTGGRISLDFRYNLGLIDYLEEQNRDFKNVAFAFFIGYGLKP
jgi:hypothetical protein